MQSIVQVKSDQDAVEREDINQLNTHINKIDSKVHKLQTEVNHLKDEQKESQKNMQFLQQHESSESVVDASDPKNQDKINRFAQMLKTLNEYKTKYKTASSAEEKKKVHYEVMDFTKKWLDTKNVQLAAQISGI